MALINTKDDFKKEEKNISKQEETLSTYTVTPNLFQINTYSSDEHKKARHSAQVIQFDIEGIKDLISILNQEFPAIDQNKSTLSISKIKVSLLDNQGDPQYGLNWGQRIGREPNQAYLQLPKDIYRSDFFPKKPTHFNVKTDDGQTMVFTRAQKTDEGTALQTPEDNSLFGRYLRERMGIPLGKEITKEAILKYGCTEITFFKVGNEYYMDFSGNTKIHITERFKEGFPVSFSASNFNKEKNSLFSRYIYSLIAKPFVILTGNSGTGKTRIANQFAKYLEKKNDNGVTNCLLLPVGADWTDNTKILGYYNPLADNGAGKYEKTDVIRFIERASANPNIPFFLILDEMNLSHVERYFSDFLSKMELLDFKNPHERVFFEISGYGKLELPRNLFVTGTVNIDETTYMFSPKVLDRANVIEFKPEKDDVLGNLFGNTNDREQKSAVDGVAEGFMKLVNKIRSENIPAEVTPILEKIKSILDSFYTELEKCGFEFAYRTVKEIRLYAIVAYETAEEETPSATDIADVQILQKILPKIYGNKKQIGELLENLQKLCKDNNLPLSDAKIEQMKNRLNRYQYTSFI